MTKPDVDRRLVLAGLIVPAAAAYSPKTSAAATAALPDDMSVGSRSAKATIVEYASVGCPVCGRWARDVYPALKAKYIDTGRARFTYREMLVGGGTELTAAAAGFVLARCAGSQKYFTVLESLYRDQDRLLSVPRETLLAVAHSCGLSDAEFNACMTNDAAFVALNARVERNSKRDDVNATPTFVVNGRKLEAGYQSLRVLEDALAKA